MINPAHQEETFNQVLPASQPSMDPETVSAYPDPYAHLLDELRWLNRLLAAHVLGLRQVNFYENLKDFRGFFTSDEEIDALISAGIFERDGQLDDEARARQRALLLAQAEQLRAEIDARVNATLAENRPLPLTRLVRCFNLNEFERQALVICLAPQIEARYEKLYAYLQNDITKKTPSVDLILSLLCRHTVERLQSFAYFHAAAPLRYFYLLENFENESTGVQQYVRLDQRVVHYLLGNGFVDQRLLALLHIFPPLRWEDLVVSAPLQKRVQKIFLSAKTNGFNHYPILYLHGRPGVGKKTLGRALCGELGLPLAVVDVRVLLRAPDNFQENLRLILREGLLQPGGVYLAHLEKLELADNENPALLKTLVQEIYQLGWIIFLASENALPAPLLELPGICPVEIPAPDHATQRALWEKHSSAVTPNEFDKLTARFDLTGAQIANAARFANLSVQTRAEENDAVTLADLQKSSRLQSQPKLSALSHKIEPKYQWGDLVLPPDQMLQLRELANEVKHKPVVMGEWGFADKLSLGRGLNALFAGPSGTGKTMAAEVMAHDLSLDLYKIDLSAVVSKYIGETEKNLNRVFTEAEHSSAILFFDEADALLGKRSEVKDAHDRYANIEIAYLLQKMEEYEGITILATNFRKNIDEAFTRRLRYIVEFPFPEEEYRRQIWQGIWPKQTPLAADLDLEFMARQFKFAGGNIKNIALASAFYAANNGQCVDMKHLIHATRREYQKMGKLCMKAEFGPYFEMLEPV